MVSYGTAKTSPRFPARLRSVSIAAMGIGASGFAEDCYVDGSRASAPIDEYLAGLIPGVEYFPVTMHYMGNQVVDVDGDTGFVESYCVAYHWKSDQAGGEHPENLVVGVRYHDSMVRAGDRWVISRRRVDPDWRTGPYPAM